MIYLIFAVLCISAIGHIFRYREKIGAAIYPVLMVNYLITISMGTLRGGSLLPDSIQPGALLLAALLGTLFVLSYAIMNHVIAKIGISLAISLSRLSLVIPTVASIVLFTEPVNLQQGLGLLLAFSILPLSGEEIPGRDNLRRLFHGGLAWGILLFLLFGMSDLIFKLKSELYPALNKDSFLVYVYIFSLVVCGFFILRRKSRFSRSSVLLGIFLGGVNYFSAFFFLSAVEALPGMIAYPLNGMLIILVSSFSSVLIWKEKLKPHHYLFLLFSIISIYLLF